MKATVRKINGEWIAEVTRKAALESWADRYPINARYNHLVDGQEIDGEIQTCPIEGAKTFLPAVPLTPNEKEQVNQFLKDADKVRDKYGVQDEKEGSGKVEFAVKVIKWITEECSSGRLRNHTNGDFRQDSTGKHFTYEQVVELYIKSSYVEPSYGQILEEISQPLIKDQGEGKEEYVEPTDIDGSPFLIAKYKETWREGFDAGFKSGLKEGKHGEYQEGSAFSSMRDLFITCDKERISLKEQPAALKLIPPQAGEDYKKLFLQSEERATWLEAKPVEINLKQNPK